MGQQGLFCQTASPSFLAHQMDLYRWRADPSFNAYLPRVVFKSAQTHHQEQKLAEFLRQHRLREYIQIDKLEQQLAQTPSQPHQQILLFEHYATSLAELSGSLTFEETLYVLLSLLSGFEQVRKALAEVVVEAECCFVTREGWVRAWINPDPKSNTVWKGQLGQKQVQIGSGVGVIKKIVSMTRGLVEPSDKTNSFYSSLTANLAENIHLSCSFSQTRKWINEYCFRNHIRIASCISLAPQQSNLAHTAPSPTSDQKQLKLIHAHSPQRDSFKSNRKDSRGQELLLKAKSVHKPSCLASSTKHQQSRDSRQSRDFQQSRDSGAPWSRGLEHSRSEILGNRETVRAREAVQDKERVGKWQGRRVEGCCGLNRERAEGVQPLSRFSQDRLSSSKQNQYYFNQRFGEKEVSAKAECAVLGVQSNILPEAASLGRDHSRGTLAKNSFQVSIMESADGSHQPQKRREPKYKTSFVPEDSISSIGHQQEMYSRPWITTKTIARLISQDHSLKESIADSASQCYQNQSYSGVLTHMARGVPFPAPGSLRVPRGSRQPL